MPDLDAIRDRIRKLLAIAKDQADTPEGVTAKNIARALQQRHSIYVRLPDDEPVPRLILIDHQNEPSPWREMLVVSMCEYAYGGTTMPMKNPDGRWLLYVVGDDIDEDVLRMHYEWLVGRIENLLSSLPIDHLTGDQRKQRFASFSLGILAHVAQTLAYAFEGEEFDVKDLPFVEHVESETKPLEPAERQFDSYARMIEERNAVFQEVCPPPVIYRDGMVLIQPDWQAFAEGIEHAEWSIGNDVIPETLEIEDA